MSTLGDGAQGSAAPTPAGRRGSSTRGSGDGARARRPVEDDDPEALARAVALRQLTVGPRSRAQLATAMARKGVPDDVAARVLDRFEEVELVDDEQFARLWVTSRHQGRGLARRALAHELRHRGIAEPTLREALDRIGPDDELAAARELVRRRLPALEAADPARRLRSLAGMLARKGYGRGMAYRAIRDELDAWGADSPDDMSAVDGDG